MRLAPEHSNVPLDPTRQVPADAGAGAGGVARTALDETAAADSALSEALGSAGLYQDRSFRDAQARPSPSGHGVQSTPQLQGRANFASAVRSASATACSDPNVLAGIRVRTGHRRTKQPSRSTSRSTSVFECMHAARSRLAGCDGISPCD